MTLWQTINDAINETEALQNNVHSHMGTMVKLLAIGNLREAGVNKYWLAKLKRELHDFDARTGEWRSR